MTRHRSSRVLDPKAFGSAVAGSIDRERHGRCDEDRRLLCWAVLWQCTRRIFSSADSNVVRLESIRRMLYFHPNATACPSPVCDSLIWQTPSAEEVRWAALDSVACCRWTRQWWHPASVHWRSQLATDCRLARHNARWWTRRLSPLTDRCSASELAGVLLGNQPSHSDHRRQWTARWDAPPNRTRRSRLAVMQWVLSSLKIVGQNSCVHDPISSVRKQIDSSKSQCPAAIW